METKCCEWCEEEYDADQLTKTDMGWLCDRCIAAILSRGESLVIFRGVWPDEES